MSKIPSFYNMDSIEQRLDLVNQYNAVAGFPDMQAAADQVRFIKGEMTKDETSSYVRLCKYIIFSLSDLKSV